MVPSGFDDGKRRLAAIPLRDIGAAVSEPHPHSRVADPVTQVGDLDSLDDRRPSLEFDRHLLQLVEEALPSAEEDGDEVGPDLVEQTSVEP